jgi:uncharacterized membrane protein YkoI
MIPKRNLASAAALVLALGALEVFAQTAATDTAPPSSAAQAVNQPAEKDPSPATIRRFESVKATMPDAIKAAEQKSGGKAFDVDFTDQGGGPVYVIDTYGNNQVAETQVDANSGQVIGDGQMVPEDQIDPDDKAALTTIGSAKTSLSQAIKSAEKKFGGRAIGASLAENSGQPSYDVTLVNNGETQRARVNADTRAVVSLQTGPGGFGSSTQK